MSFSAARRFGLLFGRRLTVVCLTLGVFGLGAVGARAATPPSLAGEFFSPSLASVSGTCTNSENGSFTFSVTSGALFPPYPGNVTESGSFTIAGGSLTAFSARFAITSSAGHVTGTKSLKKSASSVAGGCLGPTSGFFGIAPFNYAATINGAYRDTGEGEASIGSDSVSAEGFTTSNGVVALPGPYAKAVLSTPGLLAYWSVGESSGLTAFDELGAHNGTYVGDHKLGVAGALLGNPNTAVGLNENASDGHVQLPSLGTEPDLTVEGWTHLSGDAPKSRRGNNTLYASFRGVRLLVRPAGVYADDLTTGARKAIIQRRTDNNVGGWVYWALVRNGETLTVYRNATVVGSATLGTPAVRSALNGNIGATNGTYRLHGDVDEIAVYKHALTQETLLSHYHLAGYGSGASAKRRAHAHRRGSR